MIILLKCIKWIKLNGLNNSKRYKTEKWGVHSIQLQILLQSQPSAAVPASPQVHLHGLGSSDPWIFLLLDQSAVAPSGWMVLLVFNSLWVKTEILSWKSGIWTGSIKGPVLLEAVEPQRCVQAQCALGGLQQVPLKTLCVFCSIHLFFKCDQFICPVYENVSTVWCSHRRASL